MTLVTVTLDVTGMHCGSCGLLIDDTLEELDGVQRSATDVRAGRTVVSLDPGRCGTDQLLAGVAEAGYSAVIRA